MELLIFAVILLLATLLTKLGIRLGIPGMVFFLALGMFLGSEGLNIIYFDDPLMAQQIAIFALIIILFEGGFNTKRNILNIAMWPALSLATVGVIITAVTLGLTAYFVLGLTLEFSLLLGAIIASTDAAAIFSILRDKNLEPRAAATVEIESASNDPMAIILTVSLIDYIQGVFGGAFFFSISLLWQIGAGAVVGLALGKAGPMLLNRLKLETGSFYYVIILSFIAGSHGTADVINANGFIAVFLCGVVIGNSEFVFKQGVSYFLEGISVFIQVLLFVMLGLLVFPSQVMHFWQEGLIIAALLILIARPVAVFLSTLCFRYCLKDNLFLSWAGLKGAVPIVLATYPFEAGLENADYIFNTVFFVVLISALLQGTTIDFVADKLNLLRPRKKRVPHTMELISWEKSKVELLEYDVKEDSHLAGKALNELDLPKYCLVTAIVRGEDMIPPRGVTVIEPNDTLFVLVRYEDKDTALEILENPEVENEEQDREEQAEKDQEQEAN